MATVALSTTPTQIDDGTSYTVLVTNTGAVTVDLSRGGRLRPNQSRTVYPEGTALTASATSGTGQVTTAATAAPQTQAQQVAATIAGLPGTYAQAALKPRAARLLASLRDPQFLAVNPAAMASAPTFAWGTSYTLAQQYQPHGRNVTPLGHVPNFDATQARSFTASNVAGLDFYLHGDAVEFGWINQAANSELIWVWVDGVPATAAPTLPLATSTGTGYIGKITFGSVARRRITVYAAFVNAFTTLRVAAGHTIAPGPKRPRVTFLGDSYTAGANGVNVMNTYAAVAGQALGADAFLLGIGGTGYTTAQPYGQASRIASVAASTPDAVVILGSVNDDGNNATVQAAATACYAALATSLPGVPVFVVGPQATDSTVTVSANRAANAAAVRAAALAAPNVIGFADPVGTATTGTAPSAWSNGATYNQGDLVSYLGSVWRWNNGGASAVSTTAPGATVRFELSTWGLNGTGKAGSTTGDGSRDLLLSSDGVHLTAAGCELLGLDVATAFRTALLSYVQS